MELNYSSITRRLGALILDGFIVAIPVAIAGHLIPIFGGFIIVFLYYPMLEASQLKATIGKYLMGIQVVDSMGKRISFKASLIRNFLKLVSFTILLLGFVFALFTKKKQSLHDLLAETFVVYGRSDANILDEWIAALKEFFNVGTSEGNVVSQLERLEGLRQRGIITEEEFQKQKAKIIN